jgi:hypothetical protein
MDFRGPALASLLLICGCATFDPVPHEEAPFHERAQTQTRGDVTVSASVLTKQETRKAFDITMENKKMQPVWLRIENRSKSEFIFLMVGLDPDYFSAFETSRKNHFFLGGGENEKMDDYVYDQKLRINIPAEATVEGFVYTNRDKGIKVVNVDLVGDEELLEFNFILEVPGLKADYLEVDFDNLYPDSEIVEVDVPGLKRELEALPCCVLGGDKKSDGDPLNIVVIGDGYLVLAAFVNRGWHLTESMHAGAIWGTVRSSVFGSEYKTSPISPLYVYGRSQDIGLQKARGTVDERNHLRLWLSPLRFEGNEVWVGQISRDIGVKLSSKTFVTHDIDPQVDGARDYMVQDLLVSGHVESIAWVQGVGHAPIDEPRYNFTLSPYFTDGFRSVVLLSEEKIPLTQVDFYEWEVPPQDIE